MTNRTCTIDGCENKAHAQGLCPKHYTRFRRHGEAGEAASLRRPAAGTTCTVEPCEAEAASLGLCNRHYLRTRRHGAPEVVLQQIADRGTRDVGYFTIHDRVRRAYGRASDRTCIDCGVPAQQWAYDHSGRDERRSSTGLLFSLNVDAYQPMCIPCHRELDSAHS